ncbi:ATP-binding cassette domain-containing protein [Sinorhizobium sp. BG8]|uniref:ATP-binding cassette domain-containing protein n=1 Tax=Sinorhizobium sp. BG8 TaxID=2613773 RepID=UPI0032B117E2
MLTINNLTVEYSGITAVDGVSLSAKEGTITSLVGANGAGKSTVLKSVSGVVPLKTGQISFDGESLVGLSPRRLSAGEYARFQRVGGCSHI